MDPKRQSAYRFLIYCALLDIRAIQWTGPRGPARLNPFAWIKADRSVKAKGALADWLHNLALFASFDFQRFEEQRFWEEAERLARQYPELIQRYKDIFENRLRELEETSTATSNREPQ